MKNQFVILLLILSACTPPDKRENNAASVPDDTSLDVEKFDEMLSSEKDAVLLDVRTPTEVADGAIPGAVNIDFTAPDFMEKITALDKEKTYFVYCKAGGRSARAIEQMKGSGFTKLYNLKGGYDAWIENAHKSP